VHIILFVLNPTAYYIIFKKNVDKGFKCVDNQIMKDAKRTNNVAIPARLHNELKRYSEISGRKMVAIAGDAIELWLYQEAPKNLKPAALKAWREKSLK